MKENLLISGCLLGIRCSYRGLPKTLSEDVLSDLKEKYNLIPVCPEQMGGLPTPRTPSERRPGQMVISLDNLDVTQNYEWGARQTLLVANRLGCYKALLKEYSPSCGSNFVFDGTFTDTRIPGQGVTTELLRSYGIQVFSENQIDQLI